MVRFSEKHWVHGIVCEGRSEHRGYHDAVRTEMAHEYEQVSGFVLTTTPPYISSPEPWGTRLLMHSEQPGAIIHN